MQHEANCRNRSIEVNLLMDFMRNVVVKAVTLLLSMSVFLISVITVSADEPPKQVILTKVVAASFGKVWDAIQSSMRELGCSKPQTEKITEPAEEGGFYTGLYVSDFCVIVKGEDSTKQYMEQFGQIPRIRGGIWVAGRVQYKVNVKEEGIRQTKIILRAEVSGFEEFITNAIHFWTSNGILEQRMMDSIIAKINAGAEPIDED